ncbi:N-acetyltransferase [Ghiorsea bivora]|uniref:N-acetyltransferase n=1 Tax=Ghiorsea bivora TaxID=1485545 RepID=UPI00056FDC3F|nr:N-acetyltransferase [Ghiorsea bivora]
MRSPTIEVRPAQAQDVEQIYALMLPFMHDKTLISRDLDDIFEHLQEFVVAVKDEVVLGVSALHVYDSDLAEIRSLVVSPKAQRMSIGHQLVKTCEAMSRKLGITRVFALTYIDKFFLSQGYTVVAKESLPHKIWTVCVHCPKFSHCDEIAVVKTLT